MNWKKTTPFFGIVAIIAVALLLASSLMAADIDEPKYVQESSGAIYRIQLGFRKRVPDRQTLDALGIKPESIKTVSRGELDQYTDDGIIERHKIVSETLRTGSTPRGEDGKTPGKSKDVAIPEGWVYVSHSVTDRKKKGDDCSVDTKLITNRDSRVTHVRLKVNAGNRVGDYQTATVRVLVKERKL